MEKEENASEICIDALSQKREISRLAIMSMVFGILGPFCFGPILILSFYGLSFYDLIMVSPAVTTFFCCGPAWILGLVLGIKSLRQIESSEGRLAGKGYALAGIAISAAWMVFILAGLLLPPLFCVNS